MSFEVNTAKVVLNIILVRAIGLHQVDGHILTVQASLPECVVTVGPGNIRCCQRLIIGATIKRCMLGYSWSLWNAERARGYGRIAAVYRSCGAGNGSGS